MQGRHDGRGTRSFEDGSRYEGTERRPAMFPCVTAGIDIPAIASGEYSMNVMHGRGTFMTMGQQEVLLLLLLLLPLPQRCSSCSCSSSCFPCCCSPSCCSSCCRC